VHEQNDGVPLRLGQSAQRGGQFWRRQVWWIDGRRGPVPLPRLDRVLCAPPPADCQALSNDPDPITASPPGASTRAISANSRTEVDRMAEPAPVQQPAEREFLCGVLVFTAQPVVQVVKSGVVVLVGSAARQWKRERERAGRQVCNGGHAREYAAAPSPVAGLPGWITWLGSI